MSELDNLAGGIVAVAVGGAAAAGVEAVLEPARQAAWMESKAKVLDVGQLAELVAQALVSRSDAEGEALRTGYGPNKLAALIQLALEAPPYAEALDLRRRGKITDAQLTHALEKAQIEPQYWDALRDLVDERLAPAQIALGIVRSLLKDPGFLPVTLDTSGGKVPSYGVSTIDPVAEALASGITSERLRVLVGEIGLPMPLDAAAQSVFRDIINRADFNRAVLEGDTRPEWADKILDHARQIPSAADYVNAHIRGWITEDEMNAGTARHGMSVKDTHLLYLRTGRPAAPGQMATAAARGINGPDGVPMNREQFLKGIAESDIRPEWGPMLWESRFLYPPLFQITRLVQATAITAETAREWAVKDRYPPEVVGPLYDFWKQPATTKADPYVSKAETQLWGTLHRSYIAGESDEATAVSVLDVLGLDAAAQSAVIGLWENERELTRKQLTPAQIKKAWQKAVMNPASNAPWSRDDALAALLLRGMDKNDANTFLDTPSGK